MKSDAVSKPNVPILPKPDLNPRPPRLKFPPAHVTHMRHLQHLHCVLYGCRYAIHIAHGRRHNVADAAADEQIARSRAEDQIGHDSRIGAGDEKPLRRLAFRQEMKLTAARGEYVGEKPLVAFNEPLHSG